MLFQAFLLPSAFFCCILSRPQLRRFRRGLVPADEEDDLWGLPVREIVCHVIPLTHVLLVPKHCVLSACCQRGNSFDDEWSKSYIFRRCFDLRGRRIDFLTSYHHQISQTTVISCFFFLIWVSTALLDEIVG